MPATFAEAQEVLAAKLPGYTRRAHQMALAERIEQTIRDEGKLLAQAGTGTGKSLALMIPAILSGKRTVVATFNKALQTQYAKTDLPFLEEHLGVPFQWAVLKGRANYVCLARAQEMTSPTPAQKEVLAKAEELSDRESAIRLDVIDREDFPLLPEAEWTPFSMSSAECPGAKHCPFGDRCFAERARQKAAEADIVVTNTAYLMQDLILRSQTDGNVALLGDFDQLIVDEAHTLPEATTSALEDTMGEGTFIRLSRDMIAYLNREGGEESFAEQIEEAAHSMWQELNLRYSAFAAKGRDKGGKNDPMPLTLNTLVSELSPCIVALHQALDAAREEVKATRAGDERSQIAKSRLLRRSAGQMSRLVDFATDPAEKTVRWAEIEQDTYRGERRERLFLRSAPVSVAPFLRSALWEKIPVAILASATLAAGKDFSCLADTLGLGSGEAGTYDAGSPFDYPKQAMLFVPDKNAPEPSPKNTAAFRIFTQEVTRRLVGESGGGALLLFTSRTAMNEAYEALAGGFRRDGLTVMKQGDAPSGELVRVMKEDGHAVLFALRTFFEGIDIQGSALRLVVMDKLPFAVPTDLLYQARCEEIERRYNDRWASFNRLTVPSMILVLTQGFGRLIRHRDDRGVVAILDNRLLTKRYGNTILAALPPAKLTSSPEEAADFLKASR